MCLLGLLPRLNDIMYRHPPHISIQYISTISDSDDHSRVKNCARQLDRHWHNARHKIDN